MGFTSQEFMDHWIDNTKRITAGNGGCVTPAMCEREKPESSKANPLKHGFMLQKTAKIKLRKKEGGEI